MRKTTVLLLIGFLVFIAPFLGVPQLFRERLLIVLGVCTMFVAMLFRLEERRRERKMADIYHEEHDPTRTDHAVSDETLAYGETERST